MVKKSKFSQVLGQQGLEKYKNILNNFFVLMTFFAGLFSAKFRTLFPKTFLAVTV